MAVTATLHIQTLMLKLRKLIRSSTAEECGSWDSNAGIMNPELILSHCARVQQDTAVSVIHE
jgi:hypothetical protein